MGGKAASRQMGSENMQADYQSVKVEKIRLRNQSNSAEFLLLAPMLVSLMVGN